MTIPSLSRGRLLGLLLSVVVATAACDASTSSPSQQPTATPAPSPIATEAAAPAQDSAAPPSPTQTPSIKGALEATVTKVVDGDTVDVRLRDGTADTVRIIGLDTPETKKPNTPVECYGPQATAFAQRELADKNVWLVPDPTQDRRDRYDRRLDHILIPAAGGSPTNYTEEAIAGGYGIHYIYNGTPSIFATEYAAAQARAKAAGAGFWSACGGKVHGVPAVVPRPTTPGAGVYYKNCAQARAAGVTPLHRGQPGYRPGLDGDGDGIACE
jgi:micrococcal nuclease